MELKSAISSSFLPPTKLLEVLSRPKALTCAISADGKHSLSNFETVPLLSASHNSLNNLIDRIALSYPLGHLHSNRVSGFSLLNGYIVNLH